MNAKAIAACEALLSALKEPDAPPSAPAKKGNRTVAVTDYHGDNTLQNLIDCVRRATRYGRTGKTLSKAERKVMRQVIKDAKDEFRILNTNGQDVFTLNGCK